MAFKQYTNPFCNRWCNRAKTLSFLNLFIKLSMIQSEKDDNYIRRLS